MKHIVCHLDFVSPYAWLAFEQLPQVLEGLSFSTEYRPVLLGALLQHSGVPGPALVPGKREWVYRHALWLSQHLGVPLQMPQRHPFNSLPLLRLALECSADGRINRYVTGTVLRHVWVGGHDALDAARLDTLVQALSQQLRPEPDRAERAKALLRTNTEAAVAAGVFGVPAFEVDGRIFWGLDSLPMLRAYLQGDAWFDGPDWANAANIASALNP